MEKLGFFQIVQITQRTCIKKENCQSSLGCDNADMDSTNKFRLKAYTEHHGNDQKCSV